MSAWSVREAAARAAGAVLWNVSNYPERAQATMLGQDTGPLRDTVTDAVLAAVADHDGLADVLAAHVQHEEQAIVDGHVWCASCDTRIGDWTRERGIEALDAMWTAHLVDVIRTWLRGES